MKIKGRKVKPTSNQWSAVQSMMVMTMIIMIVVIKCVNNMHTITIIIITITLPQPYYRQVKSTQGVQFQDSIEVRQTQTGTQVQRRHRGAERIIFDFFLPSSQSQT